ncbi:TD and POZ domain-containing protein 1-like [Belonocnema kinseyi]|uniref:TD and POZ domain-containing protein 1-like n=1 Tax=Belonocnema kinseyi TaxID=2817044 RepID=UPI00143D255D|nr:TD and POZ domain-containing protein 1-like [Belonocnema kinseyi]
MTSDFEKTTYTWKIKEFDNLIANKCEKSSPNFASTGHLENDWSIILKWHKNTILCTYCAACHQLVCEECSQPHFKTDFSIRLSYNFASKMPPLKVKYILQNPVTNKTLKRRTVFCVQGYANSQSGFRHFISLKEIKGYVVNDVLTITCIIKQAQRDELTGLEDFMNKSSFSDVELHVGNKIFSSHKIILASKSPVFRQMFAHQLKENISNVVEIVDIDAKVFYEFLWFFYAGRVRNLKEYASALFVAADKYDISNLKTICEVYLKKNLTKNNVIHCLKLADDHNSEFLKEHCLSFIGCNFYYVAQSEDFKTLVDSKIHLLLKIADDFFDSWTKKKVKSLVTLEEVCSCESEDYKNFLNKQTWSDVEILNRGKIFHAHKLVLAAKSSVFADTLSEVEGTVKLEIQDVDPIVFYEMLRFIYTGSVENLDDIAYELLLAADKYHIENLKSVCEHALMKKVNSENVISMLKVADNRKGDKLKNRCILTLIKKLISGSIETSVFHTLATSHPHLVLEVLIMAGLNCEDESDSD